MPEFSEKLDNFLMRYLGYFNYKRYAERITLRKDENVLEVGCGGGNLSRFLVRNLPKGKLYCLDISPYWIELARRRLPSNNIDFLQVDIADLTSGIKLDTIVIHYVLHDIPKRKRERVARNIRDLLKEDGRVYIREPIGQIHGMPSEEIKTLFNKFKFKETFSREGYSFPIVGRIYEGIFKR